MGNLKLLSEAGSPFGRVLQHGDEFTRKDVEDGRLCYVGVNGVGVTQINVREDSFSYTIGSGHNKRFGEISIRIEDFLLSRTGDPNLPGFEPAGGVGADTRSVEEDAIFDPDISQEVGSNNYNTVKKTPVSTRGTNINWPDWSNWSVSIDEPKKKKSKTQSKKFSISVDYDWPFSSKPKASPKSKPKKPNKKNRKNKNTKPSPKKSKSVVTKPAKSSEPDYYYFENDLKSPDFRQYSTESPLAPLSGEFQRFTSFVDPVSL